MSDMKIGQRVRIVDPDENIWPIYVGKTGTLTGDYSDDEDCIYMMRVTLDHFPTSIFGFLPRELEAIES